ncbi:MAG: DHA2 family efflux MFS transporter permease subunit [Chloroflexota bacterium]
MTTTYSQLQTSDTTRPWQVLGITSLAVFAASLDATILFVAFNDLTRTFNSVSAEQLSWVLNAYTLVYAALLIPAGRIADIFGQRRLFMFGVALFTLASVLCGIASQPAFLIAARVLQAVGGAILIPTSLALILSEFPKEKRASAVSLWGAVGALAAAIGPSLGSAIITAGGWRWAFFINLPVGLIALYLSSRVLRESQTQRDQTLPDFWGSLLLILSVGLIVLGIVQSELWGWMNGQTLIVIISGVVLLFVFVLRSSRVSVPALDISLFKDSNYRYANMATFVFGATFTTLFFGFILFLTRVWGYTELQAGLAVTPGPLTVIPVAIIAGRIADRHGHRVLLVTGGIVFAVGGLLLYLFATTEPAFLRLWLPVSLITGIGVGLLLPVLSSAAVAGLRAERFGAGSAVNQAIRQIGGVFGVALVVVLLAADSQTPLAAFQQVFIVLIAGGLLTSAISLGIRTKGYKAKTAGPPE